MSAPVRPLRTVRMGNRASRGRVKRGNLHPEQHQIGMRAASAAQGGPSEHAGRWLEPSGNGRPRGMTARGRCPCTESGLSICFALILCAWPSIRGKPIAASPMTAALPTPLDLAFELAPVGLLVTRDRVIERCNRAFAGMFGYSRQQLVGQRWDCARTRCCRNRSSDRGAGGRAGCGRRWRGSWPRSAPGSRRGHGRPVWGRHLLGPHHQGDADPARADGVQCGMDGGPIRKRRRSPGTRWP